MGATGKSGLCKRPPCTDAHCVVASHYPSRRAACREDFSCSRVATSVRCITVGRERRAVFGLARPLRPLTLPCQGGRHDEVSIFHTTRSRFRTVTLLAYAGHALWMSVVMCWQLFWGLSLGFLLSAIIENVVSRKRMSQLLPDASPRSVVLASLLGAASSSCSYAAVAMARSAIRKGADFTSSITFQFAATNLVLELAILMGTLVGWPFAAAEAVGGVLMIITIAILFRLFLPRSLKCAAVEQAKRGVAGRMEGHAAMSMDEQTGNSHSHLFSRERWVAISHSYVMTWSMLWRDIGVGVLMAGALSAWVPDTFWQRFFLSGHPVLSALWGAFAGPLIALASFTCSVGNIPLASVLWHGGISFGGVASFIFGDLIILPILNIYRKYYGPRATAFMFVTFYAAMVIAALAVEGIFIAVGWVPARASGDSTAHAVAPSITLNYTFFLDIGFGLVFIALFAVFLRTGGPDMMHSMNHDTQS
jgi:uncharacterized protein